MAKVGQGLWGRPRCTTVISVDEETSRDCDRSTARETRRQAPSTPVLPGPVGVRASGMASEGRFPVVGGGNAHRRRGRCGGFLLMDPLGTREGFPGLERDMRVSERECGEPGALTRGSCDLRHPRGRSDLRWTVLRAGRGIWCWCTVPAPSTAQLALAGWLGRLGLPGAQETS